MKNNRIAILGAGSWGTALAINLANNNHLVSLWARDNEQAMRMQLANENARYLPGAIFPEGLTITSSFDECITNAEQIIIAVPSHAFSGILTKIKKPIANLAWITKGIDPKTNKMLSEIVFSKWGRECNVAIISGPSFAKEVAIGLPTALVVASNDHTYAELLSNIIRSNNIRCYLSDDIQGVQICGAIKNVLAIACGISDGLNYGANARAAIITRGLAEMTRLGQHLGGDIKTFMGLAGVGDLLLTCTDNQSRNRRFGIQLGRGATEEEAKKSIGQVVEGYQNAMQIHNIAQKHKIDMPICTEVYAILKGEKTPFAAAQYLMSRPQN